MEYSWEYSTEKFLRWYRALNPPVDDYGAAEEVSTVQER